MLRVGKWALLKELEGSRSPIFCTVGSCAWVWKGKERRLGPHLPSFEI